MSLRDELHADPLGKGYMAFLPDSPGTVADMLNAPTDRMVKSRMVSARTIMAECGTEAFVILDKLSAAAQVSGAVKWAMVFLSQDTGLDVGSAACQGTIAALVGGGVLTSNEGNLLANLAVQPASRMEVLGRPPATILDVIGAI